MIPACVHRCGGRLHSVGFHFYFDHRLVAWEQRKFTGSSPPNNVSEHGHAHVSVQTHGHHLPFVSLRAVVGHDNTMLTVSSANNE